MREIWGWSLLAAGSLAGAFVVVDGGFVAANLAKVLDGGYVPLILAALVWGSCRSGTWETRRLALLVGGSGSTAVETFLAEIAAAKVARVPGTAVFLTRTTRDVPPVMAWQVKHVRALHQRLFVLTVAIESIPWVRDGERLQFKELAPGFSRAVARFGFMERPDIPSLLHDAHADGCDIDLSDVTYFVGHETVVRRDDAKGLPHWIEAMYSFMHWLKISLVHVSGLPFAA